LLAIGLILRVTAAELPEFDFTGAGVAQAWGRPHDCRLSSRPEGLRSETTGNDPYFFGPARDYPADQLLWLTLRLKSDTGGNGQVFFFDRDPTEERSVRFVAPAGEWTTVRVPLPALGPNHRLRLDPPGDRGACTVARLGFAPRVPVTPPAWPKPAAPRLAADAPKVRSGSLELAHGRGFGDFTLQVDGRPFAAGNGSSLIGCLAEGRPQWLTLTNAAEVKAERRGLRVSLSPRDAGGANWRIEQSFTASARPGGIEVETRVTVDRDRDVLFLPLFTLLPGLGADFGTNKTQALLAGVEYLENEESSSERDLRGPQARRQVPDSLKLTFPLMALAADERWAGLMWEGSPRIAALHDTPDRIFRAGGSAMALLFPGADPAQREDGNVLPYDGERLRAGEALVLRATLLGGQGTTVVPAVQEFVARRGLPPLPKPDFSATEFFRLAARGWLDSAIRDGDRFRHAVGPNFGSAPAADAAFYLDWLAPRVGDEALAARLKRQAAASLALVKPASFNSTAVGHVRLPAPALVYGAGAENAITALAEGRQLVGRFRPDGSLPFAAAGSAAELGSTHWSTEANGLASDVVALALEKATFSGDRQLMADALRLLHALDRFRGGVPRGAQTWEVPLHTPDILASAYLCQAYLMGFEVTGDPAWLDEARYWAWTGVPFVYLAAPNAKPVGVYSTTPVLGATQFVAPNWIGLPVQWCGLVYANALRRLAPHDANGPWVRLADGIALAGVQHTHTAAEPDKQGLLPDSFDLRAQYRNPVPVNPATLLPLALQAYGEPAVYGFHSFRKNGWLVHAPGPVANAAETKGSARFKVSCWSTNHWQVLVNGLARTPRVELNGREIKLKPPHSFDAATGRLVLQLARPTQVVLR
jgi:hypothetical protein